MVTAREESGISTLGDILGATRVATGFPRVTRHFFEGAGFTVDVVPISGSAEITLHAYSGI